jgi:uncharacterized repeat protein (TIGR04076 family)
MYKVKCKLITFAGDEKMFPCHFNYKIGDEFYYDGVHFTGRICPGLFASMMPIIHGTFLMGHKFTENVMFRYRGIDARDPSMAKYDGLGFRPMETLAPGVPENIAVLLPKYDKTKKARGGHFTCGDTRTLAEFSCEPVDLSDADYCQPFYRRAISILEKIEAEPGIKTDAILDKFTPFQRDTISPPLTPILMEVMLGALNDMNYIEIRDGKTYPTGKEPPSRPKIG